MSAREVPMAQWSEVLDEFSREHRAWLATMDRDGKPNVSWMCDMNLSELAPKGDTEWWIDPSGSMRVPA